MSGLHTFLRAGSRFSIALLSLCALSGQAYAQQATPDAVMQQIGKGQSAAKLIAELKAKQGSALSVMPSQGAVEARQLAQAQSTLVEALKALKPALKSGTAVTGAVARVQSAYDGLRASLTLMEARLRSDEKKLKDGAAPAEYLDRQARFAQERLTVYAQLIRMLEPFFGADAGTSTGATIPVDVLDKAVVLLPTSAGGLSEAPILRAGVLPFGALSLSPRTPVTSPAISPTYERTTDTAIDPADVGEGRDVPLNDEIIGKARELGNDYVRIYQFVRNSVRTEWYSGAVKGALGTLRTLSGNDVDQASLLIALMRAAGLPARYVHGVIELPVEQIAADLGIDATQVSVSLTKAGIGFNALVRGGRVAAVAVEHTWVSAYVPYTNYRGAMVDASGKTWIPLDAAYKQNVHQKSSGIYAALGGADALTADFLSGETNLTFFAYLQKKLADKARGAGQSEAIESHVAKDEIKALNLSILPNSLPYVVVAVTREGAALDVSDQVNLRIVVRQGSGAGDKAVLDTSVPLSDAANSRLTLSYIPASLDDHRITLLYGGMDTVPLYLIGLRPQIKVGGKALAIGTDRVDPGALLRVEMELVGPFGSQRVDQTVLAGAYHAIIASASPTRASESNPADTEFLGASLLDGVGLRYVQEWQKADKSLAGLTDVAVIRPVPALTVVTNDYRTQLVGGKPVALVWQGVSMDAALWPVETAGSNGPDFMAMSALQGSSLEHAVFEEQFAVNSISADKGLALARAAGTNVLGISGAVPPALLASDHSEAVKTHVADLVAAGYVVDIPEQMLGYRDWRGSVWRAVNPSTRQAGYFISGGLAGGASVDASWVLTFLSDALAAMNSEPADRDPMGAVKLVKMGASDMQKGTVNQVLPTQLTVQVRNKKDAPVLGAPVTFSIASGDATFEGGGTSIVVPSNALGLAAASLKLGKSTATNPLFVFVNPADERPTQVGYVVIEASTVGFLGSVHSDQPFEALAYPDKFSQLRRTNEQVLANNPSMFSDYVELSTEDQYKNPLPNIDVDFSITSTPGSCPAFDSSDFLPGAICKPGETGLLGMCGGPTMTYKSWSDGKVFATVVLSNDVKALNKVHASAKGQTWDGEYRSTGSCVDSSAPYTAWIVASKFDLSGNSTVAAPPGERIKPEVSASVLRSEWSYRIVGGKVKFLPYVKNVPTDGNVSFSALGATVMPARSTGLGTYSATMFAGPLPDRYNVVTDATDIRIHVVENKDGSYEERDTYANIRGFQNGPIYAVKPEVQKFTSDGVPPGVNPDSIYLDGKGSTIYAVQAQYKIEPSEYKADNAAIDFFENGTFVGAVNGSSISGIGTGYLPRTITLDPLKRYDAQVVLNRGSDVEVRGDKKPIPIQRGIIRALNGASVSRSVDVANKRVCDRAGAISFSFLRDATASLYYQLQGADGSPLGSRTAFFENKSFSAGDYDHLIEAASLGTGKFTVILEAIAVADGQREAAESEFAVDYQLLQRLPVGQTIIRGVNARSGVLTAQTGSIGIPGRGPALHFEMTYSSSGGGNVSPVGANWQHNYDLGLVIDGCGTANVSAGDSGSVSFFGMSDGTFAPDKGYHGTLIANRADNTFDFYSKDGTRYHYVFHNQRVQWKIDTITDTNGNVLSFTYDKSAYPSPRLIRVSSSDGRELQFKYVDKVLSKPAAAGKAAASDSLITDVFGTGGVFAKVEYDAYGNVTRFSTNGRPQTFEYATSDPVNANRTRMTKAVDANGNATEYSYNTSHFGLVTTGAESISLLHPYIRSLKTPLGEQIKFTIDEVSWKTSTVETFSGTTSYEFNAYGSPVKITDPAGTTTMTWAADDVLMKSKTDARGVRTDYEYDAGGNMTSERTGSYENRYGYELRTTAPYIKSLLVSRTDRNGRTASFVYDGRGNLQRETYPEGRVIKHSYASNGDRMQTLDANDNPTRFQYNAYGNLEKTFLPSGAAIESKRDDRGRVTESTDGKGQRTFLYYDAQDNLTSTTNPSGIKHSYAYDSVGNKVYEIDEKSIRTDYRYNAANQIIFTKRDGKSRDFGYDVAGNKTSETDWLGRSTTYAYNGVNRLVSRTEPLSKITRYEYDGIGNLTKETDALDRATSHTYDVLSRRLTTIDAGNNTWSWTYDGNGNRLSSTDPLSRTTNYVYDGLNRITAVNQPLGRTTRYTYDPNGNKLTETDPNGKLTQYGYDAQDRLVSRTDALGNVARYDYDLADNLLRQTDEAGNVTQFEFDELNRKTATKDPEGNIARTYYDALGNITGERMPNGNELVHTYDAFNRRTGSSDTIGAIGSWEYDANGNLIAESDARGNRTTHAYNQLNQRTGSSLPGTRELVFDYDLMGNRLGERDARGNWTRYTYDALDHLKTVLNADAGTVAYEYDAAGNRTAAVDPRSNRTEYTYDALNRLTVVKDALSQTAGYGYDLVGNKTSETNKRSTATTYGYDALNRLVQTTKAGLTLERREYDVVGNLVRQVDANGNPTSFAYDKRRLLKATTAPLGAVTQLQRDAMGDVLQSTDAEGRISKSTYDLRRRASSQSNGAGETTTFEYDLDNHRTRTTRPSAASTRFSYDARGVLVQVRDALDNLTSYGYDKNLNIDSVTDARNNALLYTYDAMNRRTSVFYPGGSANETFTYDKAGNLSTYKDANGLVITRGYDALNRETTRTYSANADGLTGVLTGYDENDNIVAVTEQLASGNRTSTYAFDTFDRQNSSTDPFGAQASYTYDANGNRLTLKTQDGRITLYGYDALNRLTSVSGPGGGVVNNYDRSGLQAKQTFENGVTTSYAYDLAQRPTLIAHAKGTVSFNRTEYTYDINGNRTLERINRASGAQRTTYGFDLADKLIHTDLADASGSTITDWTYDAVGNRATETVSRTPAGGSASVTTRSYTYDARNQLTKIEQSGAAGSLLTHLSYDPQGNQIQKDRGGAITSYGYDANDQLISVSRDSTVLGTYRNNYLGLRIEKEAKDPLSPTGPPVKLRTLWDGGDALQDRDTSGSVVARYEFAGRHPVGLWHVTDGVQALQTDAMGSVVLVTDKTGASKAQSIFDAWGQQIVEEGASANKFGYTGHQMDDESGLIYAQARYYDPETGRFLTQDPADPNGEQPLSYNSYLYAFGNPTYWFDPDGWNNREVLGIDDASVDESIKKDSVWWGATKYAAKSTFYEVWNFATGGFVKRHDKRLDLRDSGQITQEQFERSTILDAGTSIGASVVGGAVGGKVAGAVASRVAANVAGRTVTQMAAGATAGATINTIEQVEQISENKLISDKLGRENFSVSELVQATAISALAAPVFGKAAETIDARLARVFPKSGNTVATSESVEGPAAQPSKASVPENKSVAAVVETPRATGGGNQASLKAEVGSVRFESARIEPARGAEAASNAVNPRLSARLEAWRSYQANGGDMSMKQWVGATQRHYGGVSGGYKSGFEKWSRGVDGTHGNSLMATGPHDVYVIRELNSGELLHFGETGRGYLTRFAEHQRNFAKEGIEIEVNRLRTVEGKAAAKELELKYIQTYTRIFGKRPPHNPVNH